MNYRRACFVAAIAAVLSGADAPAQSDTNQIMGQLGYPVGTELTIDGTFEGGKNSWIRVTKVEGKELTDPQLISIGNLDPFSRIPGNTICRFKGVEATGVVKEQPGQQAAPGRHFWFKVTEVLEPDGVKIRNEKSPNKASEAIGANVPQSQR